MKWRLREGHGEAIYEIGIEDSGFVRGLCKEEMAESLYVVSQLAQKLKATTTVIREAEVPDNKSFNKVRKTVAQVLVRKVVCIRLYKIAKICKCASDHIADTLGITGMHFFHFSKDLQTDQYKCASLCCQENSTNFGLFHI